MYSSKRKRTLGFRWVFIIKYLANGTIKRYKVRLVAKDYIQTYGVDYSKIFCPVAKIGTIRVLFLVVVNQDLPLLSWKIEEEEYMEAPSSFSKNFKKAKGCKLKKALYNLK